MKQDEILKALDLFKVIEARHSVRSFSGEEIPAKSLKALRAFLTGSETPFGSDAKLELIDIVERGLASESGKLTKGVIKNARYFLLVTVPEDADFALCQAGYLLERAILFATALGLSACILGGTFQSAKFEESISLPAGRLLPLVAPIGPEGHKPSLMGKVAAKLSKSGRRRELEDICFDGDLVTPLNYFKVGRYYPALEAVRLAPSARNRQPWRIVYQKGAFHFYKVLIPEGPFAPRFDLQEVDMGIAMCHFHYAAVNEGFDGNFQVSDPGVDAGEETVDYIASWVPARAIEEETEASAEPVSEEKKED